MGKIGRLIHRLLTRGATPDPGRAAESARHPEAAGPVPDEPTRCIDGKRYRMRLRNGRWESFGPPLGDCEEAEEEE